MLSMLKGSITFKLRINMGPSFLEAFIMPCNDTESYNQLKEIKQPLH